MLIIELVQKKLSQQSKHKQRELVLMFMYEDNFKLTGRIKINGDI